MVADGKKVLIVAYAHDLSAAIESALAAAGFQILRHEGADGIADSVHRSRPDLIVIGAGHLISLVEDAETLRAELGRARADLEERKLIERAKGLLMQQRNLSEADAYRTLQKLAMDRKRKLVDVARSVLDMAELFTDRK
jgi:hypothetical protein